jgi:RNA polymerase sigma-70 factor, ECF subfamily
MMRVWRPPPRAQNNPPMHPGLTQNTAHLPGFLAMPLPDEALPPCFRPVRPVEKAAPAAINVTALTQAIRRGEAAAFAQLYDLYGFRIYKHLLAVAKGDELAAREVFQTVAITLARKIAACEDERALWAWLRRVARNAFIDYCRARQRDARFVPMEETESVAPAATTGENNLREALRQVLADCAPEDRELLNAVYVDGRALGELAAQAGQSYKALESRLGRLRQKLRQKLLTQLRHDHRA